MPDEGPAADGSGSVTIIGQVLFTSPNIEEIGLLGIHFARIEFWDGGNENHDLLSVVCTDGNGNFESTVNNDDPDGGTQDLYFIVRGPCVGGIDMRNANNNQYTFTNSDASIFAVCKRGVQNNVPSGTFSFGQCDAPESQDPFWTMRDYAEYAADTVRGWNLGTTILRVPYATPGYPINARFFCDGTWQNQIHIPNIDYQDDPYVLSHEFGHAAMCHAYDGYRAPGNCPDTGHYPGLQTNVGCAWREGWAEFYSILVFNLDHSRWTSGTPSDGTMNYESFESAFTTDDEGNIAATLWDMFDSVTDGFDTVATAFSSIMDRLATGTQDHLDDFRDAWFAWPVPKKLVVQAAYQQEIDYDTITPISSLTAPTGPSWLRGSVTLAATASDADSDIQKVSFYRTSNGSCGTTTSIGSDTSSPYTYAWSSTSVSDVALGGLHFCTHGISLDGTPGSLTRSTAGYGVDNTLPTGSVSAPGIAGPLSYEVAWQSSDAMSGVAPGTSVALQELPPGAVAWQSACTGYAGDSCTRNPTQIGTWCYRIVVRDVAGNVFTSSGSTCTLNTG